MLGPPVSLRIGKRICSIENYVYDFVTERRIRRQNVGKEGKIRRSSQWKKPPISVSSISAYRDDNGVARQLPRMRGLTQLNRSVNARNKATCDFCEEYPT